MRGCRGEVESLGVESREAIIEKRREELLEKYRNIDDCARIEMVCGYLGADEQSILMDLLEDYGPDFIGLLPDHPDPEFTLYLLKWGDSCVVAKISPAGQSEPATSDGIALVIKRASDGSLSVTASEPIRKKFATTPPHT